MLSSGHITKMASTQPRAVTFGCSLTRNMLLPLTLILLGLGFGSCNCQRRLNFSFGWHATIRCLLYPCYTIETMLTPKFALGVVSLMKLFSIVSGIVITLDVFGSISVSISLISSQIMLLMIGLRRDRPFLYLFFLQQLFGGHWAWRNKNLMLGNDNWYVCQLSFNIQGMVDTLKASYPLITNSVIDETLIKWNNNNHSHVILNIDGSCLGSPTKFGYGGVLRNEAGFYLSDFSGYIHDTSDILYAELYAIYQGLLLAKEKGITNLIISYSDSLLCINIVTGPM